LLAVLSYQAILDKKIHNDAGMKVSVLILDRSAFSVLIENILDTPWQASSLRGKWGSDFDLLTTPLKSSVHWN